MNTNRLKKFAQETRKKLLEQVSAKVDYVITADTPELRENAALVAIIKAEITAQGKQQLVDKVAYTWFNRFVALRYMDINGYQPLGINIVSVLPGQVSPQILQEAFGGHIPEDLNINVQKVLDLLDGRTESRNAQNEAYRYLLISACNYLNRIFPFLFERINDYTELLLPDDLTSQFSVLHNVKEGLMDSDCRDVECIGWLYQFYISEKKDALINAKKRYKADEIAPVTQLFTPKWIVQYMVDNTLGQYWIEARPNTSILSNLEFYIKPVNPELLLRRNLKSPEEIKLFDPCVGSAHVLCYAFDVLYKIYEEEGFNSSEIPKLILTKNLYGIDIDDRATQLAGFALMMKGRQYDRRLFHRSIIPNVISFQNSEAITKFKNAKIFGSLINVTKEEAESITIDETSLFRDAQSHLKEQALFLSNEYDVVVTNPPYLNSSYMDVMLKQFVEKEYSMTKSDLFACFLKKVSCLSKKDGLVGFICPYTWMFIQSYEKLREYIIGTKSISSLIQLEYNAFGPAVVPICTFVLRNEFIGKTQGSYIRLSDFTGAENQAPKTLEAIRNTSCDWHYNAFQKNFNKIPGSPIGYWLSENFLKVFNVETYIGDIAEPRQGLASSDNSRFLKEWYEVIISNISFKSKNRPEAMDSGCKWFPYNKGGSFRKWFGNNEFIVNWQNDGEELLNFAASLYGSPTRTIKNIKYYFKPSITWSALSSGGISLRKNPSGFLFDTKGQCVFSEDESLLNYIMALLNSVVAYRVMQVLAPTLDFNSGVVAKVPFIFSDAIKDSVISDCISISKLDWNSRETSWDFCKNEFLNHEGQDLEETYDLYQQYWKNKFSQLHKNEEELNRQFIKIYGLQEELTPDVALDEITILKEEASNENRQLRFHAHELMAQFISYAVGCMFGRYSLDREGLILANQGETGQDFFQKIGKTEAEVTFAPDKDNIIPILEDEWFEDDVVSRFYQFLKASFGEKDFQKNLAFLEEQLGCTVRKFFTREFYTDHIRRYSKRPIYWMFSSPKSHFNVLIYLHRYTPDTLNMVLNNYLRAFIEKLKVRMETLKHIETTGSPAEKTRALKEMDKISAKLLDCHDYEHNILYPMATERIAINLDNGVLVNYNCFGKAVKEVAGLNDAQTKKKVKKFDWIDPEIIR